MPKIKRNPKLNALLESVYDKCMLKHKDEKRCAITSWKVAKQVGWKKEKGIWKK